MGPTPGSVDRASGDVNPSDLSPGDLSPGVRRAFAGLAGAAVMISVITVFSRLLGFGRTMVFVYAVGPTTVGDAYSVANTLPNVLFEVAAGGALAGALIPVISGPLARGLRADVDRIASAVLGWALLVLSILAVALVALADPIAGAFVTVAGPERDLLAELLIVFAPQIPLYGIAVVLSGVLQAQRRLFWPAFAPVLSSVVVISAYLVFRREVGRAGLPVSGSALGDLPPAALAWLAWGTTAGVAAMSLPLFVPTWRSGVRLRPTLRFPPGVARRVGGLAVAGVGALWDRRDLHDLLDRDPGGLPAPVRCARGTARNEHVPATGRACRRGGSRRLRADGFGHDPCGPGSERGRGGGACGRCPRRRRRVRGDRRW